MRLVVVAVIAVGCGRIGFSPESVGPTGDGATDGDGASIDGDPMSDGSTVACRFDANYTTLGALRGTYRVEAASNLAWTAARDLCAADGAYLVILDDLVEAQTVSTDWVGITDAAVEGTWLTVLGDPAPFEPWGNGEPSGGTTANCARLDDSIDQIETRACTDTRDFTCECD